MYQRGDRVVVEGYAGRRAILTVWEDRGRGIALSTDKGYQRLLAGDPSAPWWAFRRATCEVGPRLATTPARLSCRSRDLGPTLRTKPLRSQPPALRPAELAALDPLRVFGGQRLRLGLAKYHVHDQLGALVGVAGHLALLHYLSMGRCLGNVNGRPAQTETLPAWKAL